MQGKTHLTAMNAFTKMSEKGQVVIPKDVRRRLRIGAGDQLEVIERPDGVLLRKPFQRSGESFDAVTARIRTHLRYDGPPVSIADMDQTITEMWAAGGPRWDQ